MKLDISAIILTYNEEIHIRRCLDQILHVVKHVYIIDSFSTDRTIEIAKAYSNVTILQKKWENNYAKQFNWGLSHAPITTGWVLRLDADEYLTEELIEELHNKLPTLTPNISGLIFKRRHIFLGKWVKRGVYPVKLLRLFRYNFGECEQRLMDEHIQLSAGEMIECEFDFVDHNLNDLSWFCHKHVNYAIREAADLLDIEYGFTSSDNVKKKANINIQAKKKRNLKNKYVKQPLFWRSATYFCYRYFLKGGFREGKEGFLWAFIQGWWYRTLVDAKIYEIKKICNNQKIDIKFYLKNKYGIDFDN